ncbi:MAG: squalene--hopene cyclase [Thermoanaerobaculia bacterium]
MSVVRSDEASAIRETRPASPETLAAAIEAAQRHLIELQAADGHWCAELEGDAILECEYILTMAFLGRAGSRKVAKAAEYLRRSQLPEGGWSTYPGGPADVNPTVKGYFALKLAGDTEGAPHMVRARHAARRLGGIEACNSFTKIYLAVFGQYDWDDCPAVPPELVLFPSWFPFNLYEMSSWTRAIVVPLSLIWAYRPLREVPAAADISELWVPGFSAPRKAGLWSTFFHGADRLLKMVEARRLRPFRWLAVRRAEEWVRARVGKSDGLGGIFPPIINTIIGFMAMGHGEDDPTVASQIHALEELEIEEDDTLRVQPCKSPVWDTVLTLSALADSGLDPASGVFESAAHWILDKEVRDPGDWRFKARDTEVGGWYFEYANEFYPDCDDTAQALTSLSKLRLDGELAARAGDACRRAISWLEGMQSRNGGWASFDKDCDAAYLTHIPFADHNAMIDPAMVDITSRVIEAFIRQGVPPSSPAVRRGLAFIRREQEEDGSWYGRWGCNYLYGTWLALSGLAVAGEDLSAPWARRAVDWLFARQNEDGGWGELPASYSDPERKGHGPSTASQTAWALMGLVAAGAGESEAVRRGVDYLLATQTADGSWIDHHWTGTGFPEVFYLRYHLYATYFPLQALGLYRQSRAAARTPSR